MSDEAARELGAENEAQLGRLRRVLASSAGFQLVILEIPESALRAAVVARVLGWSGVDGVPVLEHVVVAPDATLEDALGPRSHGVVLEGLDGARTTDATVERAFGSLNWQRDRLRREIGGPLVLVLSARGVAKLFERAPDLATWRAHSCRISAVLGASGDVEREYATFFADQPDPLDLDAAEAALSATEAKGAPHDALARAWLAAARARRRAGDLAGRDEALAAAERHVAAGVAPDTAADAIILRTIEDVDHGRGTEARGRIGELDALSRDGASSFAAAWASFLRAVIALQERHWHEAVPLARDAIRLADQHGVSTLREATRSALISAWMGLEDFEAAYTIAVELVALASGTIGRARALRQRANVNSARGRLDLALDDLEAALGLVVAEPGATKIRADLARQFAWLAAQAAASGGAADRNDAATAASIAAAGAAAADGGAALAREAPPARRGKP